MKLTIYTANCCGDKTNTVYPNKCVVESVEDFSSAIASDHVCAEYRNMHRSKDDFIMADCTVMDNDNSHSDDPKDWIYPEDYDKMFHDVPYIVAPSRNDMKVKDGKSARPRNHVYFPISTFTDNAAYSALKSAIVAKYPFFDIKALDAARFIYGNATDNIIWHEGRTTIDCVIDTSETYVKRPKPPKSDVIPQGTRNSTMSEFAGKVVKRYGFTKKAHDIFMERAEKCEPPLDDKELATIWRSAGKFAKKVQSQKGYVQPGDYEFGGVSLKPSDYSDIGQAKIIARECGGELCYTIATDYLRFDGKSWVESKEKAVGAVEEFLDRQLEDALGAVSEALDLLSLCGIDTDAAMDGGKRFESSLSPKGREAYEKLVAALKYQSFVLKRRDMKYVTSAMQAARPMIERSPSDLDVNGFLLNTPIGTYDLTKGINGLREHRAEDYITKITSVAPSDEGKKEWLESLNYTFQGNAELIDYVQQIAGLCAVGNVYREELIISYGVGSNGKSTFWNSISSVLGNYSGNISADALTVGCKRNVKPELAEAKGKRLLIAAELEEGMRLNTSTVKQLCSTDEIFAEKKYKDPFSFKPSHTLVLYTNHLPRVGAMDDGIWRRMIVIPFKAKIKGKKDIKNYSEYLVKNCGGYILKWIIEGAEKVIANGFVIEQPDCVRAAITKFKSDNDWLTHYLDECCIVEAGLVQKSGELYSDYRAYCLRVGEFARSTTEFYNALDTRGFVRKTTKKGSFISGVRLKDEDLV